MSLDTSTGAMVVNDQDGKGKGKDIGRSKVGTVTSSSFLRRLNVSEFVSSTKIESLVDEINKMLHCDEKQRTVCKPRRTAGKNRRRNRRRTAGAQARAEQEEEGDNVREESGSDYAPVQDEELGSKAIVFSQFTNMLELVEWRLKKESIKAVKLVGSMALGACRGVDVVGQC